MGGKKRRRTVLKVIKKKLLPQKPQKAEPQKKPEESEKSAAFDAYAAQCAAVDSHKLQTATEKTPVTETPATEMATADTGPSVENDPAKPVEVPPKDLAPAEPAQPVKVTPKLLVPVKSEEVESNSDKIMQVLMKMGHSFADTQDAINSLKLNGSSEPDLTIDKVLDEIHVHKQDAVKSCDAEGDDSKESQTDIDTEWAGYDGWDDSWSFWDPSWWDYPYWRDNNSWKWTWSDETQRMECSWRESTAWSRGNSNASLDSGSSGVLNSPTEAQVGISLGRGSTEHLDGEDVPKEEPLKLSSVYHIYIHPGRLTWNIQITHLERKMIFQTSMIMFHVYNLQGCTLFDI